MKKTADILISWPDGKSNLNKILNWGGVNIQYYPKRENFNFKKDKVGIVQDGVIVLTFRVKNVIKVKNLSIAVSSNKTKFKKLKSIGSHLSFIKNSLEYPNTPCKQLHFYSYGQFKLFDLQTNKVKYSQSEIEYTNQFSKESHEQNNSEIFISKPYNKKFLSINRTPAELNLINAYVEYCNLKNYALHPYIKSEKMYADLFIKSKWRLIEAKALIDRKTIRQAVGQLFDYKQQYLRKPSIGLLLPEKPSLSIIKYLNYCKVTAIWRTDKGFFRDSNNGSWSSNWQ